MTRKDYIKLAAAIRAQRDIQQSTEPRGKFYRAAIDAVAESIAAVLAADNPNFDRQRFLTACGLEDK